MAILRLIRGLPLQLRLIATVAVALAATLVLGIIPVYWHASSKVETEMQSAIEVGERVARNELSNLRGAGQNSRHLTKLIAHFDGDRHVKAALLATDGTPVATSHLAPPEEKAPDWFHSFLGAMPKTVVLEMPAQASKFQSIVIEANPTNEVAEAWTDLKFFAAVMLVLSILILGLISWIVAVAIKPIQALIWGFGEIGAGNYGARVEPGGSPELERLCTGFNDMGERLGGMAARNRRLAQQLEQVQEEERADLARDLHDEVSPLLFSVDVDATMVANFAEHAGEARLRAQAKSIRDALAQMKRIVTSILGRLRPAILLDQGLSAAVDNLVVSWRTRHPGVKFDVSIPHMNFRPEIASVIFFVVREAVSNALRHSDPACVGVELIRRSDCSLVLQITDDGAGLPISTERQGFGIIGMEERVSESGGELTVRNRRDRQGVIVEAVLPLGPVQQDLTEPRVEQANVV